MNFYEYQQGRSSVEVNIKTIKTDDKGLKLLQDFINSVSNSDFYFNYKSLSNICRLIIHIKVKTKYQIFR